MPSLPSRRPRRALAAIAVAALLGATLPLSAASDPAQRARESVAVGDYAAASRYFEEAAMPRSAMTGEYLLSAAEAALVAGDDARAEGLLSRLPADLLDRLQSARADIVRARILMNRKLWFGALQALPDPAMVPTMAPRILGLRGQCLFQLGDPLAAVRTLVLRERSLGGDAAAIAANRQLIWDGLVAVPIPADEAAGISREEPITRGWLELALALQERGQAGAEDWSRRHAGHPGLAYASQVRPPAAGAAAGNPANAAPAAAPLSMATTIPGGAYALLLPGHGPFAASAAALRDGFVTAWLSTPGLRRPLRIYDSGTTQAEAVSAYRQALGEGAAMIVGPLQRESVAAVAAQGAATVPVLALNYADTPPTPNLLQYGLAPEDEARAAARQAFNDRRRRASIVIPASDWGERVLRAFQDQFMQLGGTVASVGRYAAGSADYSDMLRSLMNLDASKARHRALNDALGMETEFEPRRRRDIDMLFIAARPADARLIFPQLSYFRAGALPVYATALLNDGRAREFDGTIVCDMPWMIDAAGPAVEHRMQALAWFPDMPPADQRLFAMGADAYALAQRVARGEPLPGLATQGDTGLLQAGSDGRIARLLACAELRDGRPEPLGPPP